MLMARPSPETSYTTVSVAPATDGPVGLVEGVLGSVGNGKTGRGVRDVVLGVGIAELGTDKDGSGARTVCWRELLTITSAVTRQITRRTAIAATTHSQRGELGPSGGCGGCGGSPGGYCGPYWPVAWGS